MQNLDDPPSRGAAFSNGSEPIAVPGRPTRSSLAHDGHQPPQVTPLGIQSVKLVRHLAVELAPAVRVNAIAPGPFPTWMLSTGVGFGGETEGVDWDAIGSTNPSGRVCMPEDIAGLAIFLSSRAVNYVVGQTIACDGGVVAAS